MFVGLMTPQGILIEANRPALAAAGLRPEDVLGKPFEDTYWWAYSPDVQQQLREAIARAARGEASRYDVQVRVAEHQFVDIDFSLQPLRDEAGEVVSLVPSASVITERKRTENALRESNEKFQLLADNITDAFWIRSPDMREVHYVSPAFERIWGRSAESLRASPHQWADFTVPEDRERVLAAFAALTGDTPSLDIEYRIVRPGGEIRWVRARGFQVRDAAGRLIRLTGIVTDITERKRVEDTLRESEERFSGAFEHAPIGVALVSPDGRWLKVNRALCELVGYSEAELLARTFQDITHPEDLELDLENVRPDDRRRNPLLPDGETLRPRARTPRHGVVERVTGPRWPGSAAILHLPDSGHHRAQTGGAGIADEHGGIPHPGGSDAANRLDHAAGWLERLFQPALDGVHGTHPRGKPWRRVEPSRSIRTTQQRARHAWQHATATIGTYSLECRLRRADGVYRWWLIRGVPQRGADRRRVQLVWHLHRYSRPEAGGTGNLPHQPDPPGSRSWSGNAPRRRPTPPIARRASFWPT